LDISTQANFGLKFHNH